MLWRLQAYWTSTVHAVLLVTTGTAALGLLPFLYFGFHWYWQRSHTQPAKPAAASSANARAAATSSTQPQAGELAAAQNWFNVPAVQSLIMDRHTCECKILLV